MNISMNKKELMNTRLPLYLSGLLLMFGSCSSNDHELPILKPHTPNTEAGHRLTSVIHAGNVPNTYDWTFTYHDDRLTKAAGVYKTGTEEHYSYESTLTYGYKSIKVSSTGNDKSTLTLNEQEMLGHMTVNKNKYEFRYDNGYLTEWTEQVVSESFGQVTSYTSHADIVYTISGNLKEIIYTENQNYPYDYCQLTFNTTDTLNVNGLLPEAVSREMGCLGFEHLYYAGVLGRATRNLVRDVTFTYPLRPEKNKTIRFMYALRGNDVTLCNYTNDGQPVSTTYLY